MEPTLDPTFRAPRTFSFVHSPLGQLVRQYVPDARRAESLHLVIAVLGLMAFAVFAQWSWFPVRNNTPEADFLRVAALFLLVQAAFAVVYILLAFVGFRPELEVAVEDDGLRFSQGETAQEIAFASVRKVERLDARTVYRHHARYAATQVFSGPPTPDVLVLDTVHGPVVVGLETAALTRLEALLAARIAPKALPDAQQPLTPSQPAEAVRVRS